MARPKNNEHRQDIAVTAYSLFLEKGYNKASYRDIAKACNDTSGIIQHYYPKKENLLLDLLSKILTLIEKYIAEKSLETNDPFANMFIVGQIYFNFLINCSQTNLLSKDIFESRRITQQVLLLNEDWTYRYMKLSDEEKQNQAFITDISVGGAYDIGYRCLVNNETVDIHKLIGSVFDIFMAGFKIKEQQIKERLSGHNLSDETLTDSSRYLLTNILIPEV